MNRRTLISLFGLAGLVALLWLAVRGQRPNPQPGTVSTTPAPPAQVGTTGVTRVATPPSATKPPAGRPVPPPAVDAVVLENAGTAAEVVRVNANQVLGTVNGVAITLKDLVPVAREKAGTDQVLSAEMFGFLLNRAVDRELTVQAARSQGVELSEEHRQRLSEHQARSSKREDGVFDTLQHSSESTEFQQRDLSAMALQYSLAEKAGVPSPHVTTEHVAAYYQQHQAEYRALPPDPAEREAAWEVIDQDIRSKLAPDLQVRHEAALKKFLDQLRASAQVVLPKP